MPGQFVSNLSPGNFGTDGVYYYNAPTQQVTPYGPAVSRLGIIGTGQWGAKNTPTAFGRAADGYAAFGPNTALNNSIMRDALAAMPECVSFFGVRVTDTTDTAATIVILDGASTAIATLTAQFTGSLPNGVNALGNVVNPAQASLTIVSGTLTASPVLKLAISFPNQPVEIYNIVAYATAGGAYAPATFKANLLTAINVGSGSTAPSPRWTATSGTSTAQPVPGTVYAASGGTDGATTITTSVLIGQDGVTGRTGLYALRGTIPGGQLILAGCSDTTASQTLAAFNRTEGTRAAISFPIGTSTATAQTLKATNSASDPTLDTCIDWDLMTDPWSGQPVYVAPAAAVSGIIASLDFYQSPSNKPYGGGKLGIYSTERSANPLSQAEAATRQAGGIMYLTKPINRANVWGLPHGMASDGTSNISDIRAINYIGLGLMQVLGAYVGEPQSQLANDVTRVNARGAVNMFMSTLLSPTPKISSYSNVLDLSNNTPVSISQGFLVDNISVTTLAGVKFILVNSQVGTGVGILVQAA